MGRRPQANHRLAGPQVGVDLPHLLVGERAKPRGDHHHVRFPEGLEARDVVPLVRIDHAGLGVDRVEHRALEAVVLREDLRQLREGLLAAVLLVAAHEHDVLALARPLTARDRKPRIAAGRDGGHERQPKHDRRNDLSQHGIFPEER